jgi:kexin
MRFSSTVGLAVLACSYLTSATSTIKPRNYETHDYFTLHLRSGESPTRVARALGVDLEGQLGELDNHYYFSVKKGAHGVDTKLEDVRRRIKKREVRPQGLEGILWSQKQKLKPRMHKRTPLPAPPIIPGKEDDTDSGHDAAAIAERQHVAKELDIADPIFAEQWHLFNTLQLGHDVNVTGVWLAGNTGKGATVAVLDDGIDMYSDDLKDNYYKEGSYDFNDHSDEPKPKLSDDRHGTRCAGEISAVKNNVCGVGIAYDSKIAGIRILGGTISDEDEALAINYKMDKNQIYSCSWGPPDDGMSMDAPDSLIKTALLTGIQKGRDGLGSVFVFAAGNGAASEDNCNFDGYTNSIYSITVGAIDRKGGHPYYSEKCSASLVVTYSSGAGDAIHTTDVGTDTCYAGHGGTSAAAPIAVGLYALVLSERPDLNWRDLQYLTMETAVPINLEDGEWQDTFSGKKYSHTYAYGKLDAWAIVEKAKTWKSVKPQAWYKSPWQHVKHPIPQGNKGLASSFEVTDTMLRDANLERVEHITVTMNVEHTRRGDLSVELVSPHGISSHLSATRRNDKLAAGYEDWTFMSVVHW